MSNPRLEVDLDKIFHKASTLVARLKTKGVSVTGVNKASLGAPEMLRAGVISLGDLQIENIELTRRSAIAAQMRLMRSPMLRQIDQRGGIGRHQLQHRARSIDCSFHCGTRRTHGSWGWGLILLAAMEHHRTIVT